jgi:hypothetical protein
MDNMKVNLAQRIIASALLLCFLAACSTSSGHSSSTPRYFTKPEDRDKFAIEVAVYRYLFGLGFWKQRAYSATLMPGTDEEVRRLMRELPNQVPKIKPSSVAELLPHSTPIDKETGKPAVILAATASEPDGARATAIGSYYAGAMIRGKFWFWLRKSEGQWAIETVKEISPPEENGSVPH